MLFCCQISLLCDLRCFVAKSVLSRFCACGEKRRNMRDVLVVQYIWAEKVNKQLAYRVRGEFSNKFRQQVTSTEICNFFIFLLIQLLEYAIPPTPSGAPKIWMASASSYATPPSLSGKKSCLASWQGGWQQRGGGRGGGGGEDDDNNDDEEKDNDNNKLLDDDYDDF